MQLAVNWSPQAAALLKAGAIAIDLYKCPDWPDLVTQAEAQNPVYIHFPIVIGMGQTWDFAALEQWLTRTNTPFVNAHYAPKAPYFPAGIDRDGLLEATGRELETLVQHFGAERVILENIPYVGFETRLHLLPVAVEAAMLCDVITAAGCGLLLDLSHAVLTCENRGWRLDDYLAALPLDRLRELHITGIGVNPMQGEREDHLPLQDEDWARVEAAFAQIRAGAWAAPHIVALEYGGIGPTFEWRSKADVLARDVPRLAALCAGVKQGI